MESQLTRHVSIAENASATAWISKSKGSALDGIFDSLDGVEKTDLQGVFFTKATMAWRMARNALYGILDKHCSAVSGIAIGSWGQHWQAGMASQQPEPKRHRREPVKKFLSGAAASRSMESAETAFPLPADMESEPTPMAWARNWHKIEAQLRKSRAPSHKICPRRHKNGAPNHKKRGLIRNARSIKMRLSRSLWVGKAEKLRLGLA